MNYRKMAVAGWCCVLAVGAWLPPAMSAEPAREFLSALREKGYFDEAIEYLDSIAASPEASVPVDFRNRLGYERGRTLLQGAAYKRDPVLRAKDYEAAKVTLDKFIAELPNDLYALNAKNQVAQITMLQGAILADRAKKTPDKKKELLAQAVAKYNEAIADFTEIYNKLKETPDGGVPKVFDAKKNPHLVEKRDRWREDYVTTARLIPETRERLADCYDPGSKEHTDTLTAAAKEFEDLYKKYDNILVGLIARKSQGVCLLKIQSKDAAASAKRVEMAMTVLDEIIKMDDPDPLVREVVSSANLYVVKSWLDQKKYKEAFDKGHAWLDNARPNELLSDEMQELRLAVAAASLKLAEEIKAKTPGSKELPNIQRFGFAYAKAAQKMGAPYKDQAEALITQFPKGIAAGPVADPTMAKTFDKAYDQAVDAMESINPAQLIISTVKPRIAKETDAKNKEDLEKQVKEAEETLANAKPQAMKYFANALRLRNNDSDPGKVDVILYYLCYLNYDAENYFDTIALGEYLAINRPESVGARPGAMLAMAACQKLYVANKEENKDFETNHITRIAGYIVEKWPKEKEAGDALNILFPFLIKAGKIAEIEKYRKNIDPESPQRAMVELKTGQVVWSNYLSGMRKIRELEKEIKDGEKDGFAGDRDKAAMEAEIKTAREPLEELKQNAMKTLEEGVARMKGTDQINPTLLLAALSLAQIYVDTDQAAKAIELMEDKKIGPLTLLHAKSPDATKTEVAEEIYRTSLRAYISSLATAQDRDAVLTKAKGIMDGLKTMLGEEGHAKLVQNYLSIARDLQTQLDLATDEKVRENLAAGFQVFLDEVGKASNEYSIQSWVAETYKRMGDAFGRDASGGLTDKAKQFYAKAMDGYKRVLEKGEQDPKYFPTPQAKLSLQRLLANGYRDIGQYEEAAGMYKEILAKSPGFINVQMEAAYNYQIWAGDKSNPENYKRYVLAIQGPGQNSPIWGWQMIAKKIAGNETYLGQYYECRYNLSYARFRYAMGETDAEKKKKILGMTQTEIGFTYRLNPSLGTEKFGNVWKDKFEKLMQNLQTQLGVAVTGLKAFDAAPAPAAGAAAAK